MQEMNDVKGWELSLQIGGLVLLACGIWAGYRHWIASSNEMHSRGAGLLVLLALFGGLLGSIGWWLDMPQSFAWDLPPLVSRMLGAAGLTFAGMCWLVLRQPTTANIRLALVMLAAYLAPLLVAVVCFHLNRLDFQAPITYAFFIVIAGMSALSLYWLFETRTSAQLALRIQLHPRPCVKVWLGTVALVTGLWGTALFVTDNGGLTAVWAWPGDLLSSRLIAAMLLAISTGAYVGSRQLDASRIMLVTTAIYGLGIIAANIWSAILGKPVKVIYVLVFLSISLASILVLMAEHRRSRIIF